MAAAAVIVVALSTDMPERPPQCMAATLLRIRLQSNTQLRSGSLLARTDLVQVELLKP